MANKLILGTVQFGLDYGINNQSGKPSAAAVGEILDLAFENGIRLLDTAEAYGDAQEVIGNYHRTSFNTFGVITKYSAKRNDLPASLTERIAENLETLRVPSLYSYMFHSFSDFETYYSNYKTEIDQLKQKGLIKKFGVSIYTNAEFEKLLTYDTVELVQLPFNLLDNTSQRLALLTQAKEKGMEVHTRSVFLQGLFFKNTAELPTKLQPLKPYLDEIRQASAANGLSLNDLALNYAVQQNTIDHVLLGVDTADQLKENLASLSHSLPVALMEHFNALAVKETELLNPANWN